MKHALSLLALFAAMPVFAEDTRQIDAHEHGVGTLNIAIDNANVFMEFEAPGADLVGFEHAAESDADRAAIDAAIAALGAPLDVFILPEDAGCRVTTAEVALEGEHGDDEEEHADHDDASGHTEFHAEYMLTCDNPDALNQIEFAYFDTFPNAQEVEVQLIDKAGAQAFEVERAAPVLDLGR